MFKQLILVCLFVRNLIFRRLVLGSGGGMVVVFAGVLLMVVVVLGVLVLVVVIVITGGKGCDAGGGEWRYAVVDVACCVCGLWLLVVVGSES